MSILLVDDEKSALRNYGGALANAGLDVVRVGTASDALRELYTPGYTLIVLDLRMPQGDVLDAGSTETGFKLFDRIRNRYHLNDLPVIILSQFCSQVRAPEWIESDPLFKMLSKSVKPRDFVPYVKSFQALSTSATTMMLPPADEDPNVAPYYVRDATTGQPVRIRFSMCNPEDLKRIAQSPDGKNWKFRHRFDVPTAGRSQPGVVLKVTKYEESERGDILGVYAEGRPQDNGPYWEKIYFETSPSDRRGQEGRQFTGLGKAMVARYVRRRIYEGSKHSELPKSIAMPNPGDLHGNGFSANFLISLGFKQDAAGTLVIDMSTAQNLLQEVSTLAREDSFEVVERLYEKEFSC